jgi:hypothetical protein
MTVPVPVSASRLPDNSRTKKILVAGLLLVLLLFVVPKFLGGGSSGDDGAFEASLPAATAPVTTPAPAAHRATPAVTKDPFHALVSQQPAGGKTASVGTPPPAAVPAVATASPVLPVLAPAVPVGTFSGIPGLPGTTTTPTPTTTPAGNPAGAIPAPAPAAVRIFRLENIYDDGTGLVAATVRVDGAAYSVAVGQDFAFSYRVLGLDRESLCGVFLYGTKRFSLCTGEQLRT